LSTELAAARALIDSFPRETTLTASQLSEVLNGDPSVLEGTQSQRQSALTRLKAANVSRQTLDEIGSYPEAARTSRSSSVLEAMQSRKLSLSTTASPIMDKDTKRISDSSMSPRSSAGTWAPDKVCLASFSPR